MRRINSIISRIVVFIVFIILSHFQIVNAQNSLTVEKIMQNPKWMGTFPSNVQWGENGKAIFFNYNKEGDPADSLYKIEISNLSKITKVSINEIKSQIPSSAISNLDFSKKVYAKNNELFLYDIKSGLSEKLISFSEAIVQPVFLANQNRIGFSSGVNYFIYDLAKKNIEQVAVIKTGKKPETKNEKLTDKDQWVKTENLELLGVVKERIDNQEKSKAYTELLRSSSVKEIYLNGKTPSQISLSPDEKFLTLLFFTRPENKRTDVPDYVDASGYTKNIPTRSKVGDEPLKTELGIIDLAKDSLYFMSIKNLPGLTDLPDYISDYPDKKWEAKERDVVFTSPVFSGNGKNAVINIRSSDNKDRWIALLDLSTGELKSLDRQRDEAWIAGPGIGYSLGGATMGWLPDHEHIYYQSEETGYSHLYILNVTNGSKKALTKGNFEVFNPFLSKDKKHWFLTTSEVHPGERHFYKMPLMGGKMEKLTSMTGNNEVSLSPDEKQMAILYAYSNVPWELYLSKMGETKAIQLTDGRSEDFKSYAWRDPQIVKIPATDGAEAYARLYTPDEAKKNGAAVIFVHGAGYLQNVHKWWSSYFREYMFHNLLTDLGYTVLDIDYRGSAGYGRDWRTGIYRHMGGKDLSDHIDGANFLVKNYGVDKDKVGIYGGSYGGFITLMGMFTAPEVFKAGAALRSVTDWAHYNHGYTSNILNNPVDDPISYRKSSPIYFAEGLKGDLLIAHGMVDVNVHFQDVVRLAQRLIELEKDNWEFAVYPVEDHGFVEPSSWTDEYKRILKLFNNSLLK
jgi:dipeptidyl aminopeptidase/acylaminoacyl peptidase